MKTMTLRELFDWHTMKADGARMRAEQFAESAEEWEAKNKADSRYLRRQQRNQQRLCDFHQAAADAIKPVLPNDR